MPSFWSVSESGTARRWNTSSDSIRTQRIMLGGTVAGRTSVCLSALYSAIQEMLSKGCLRLEWFLSCHSDTLIKRWDRSNCGIFWNLYILHQALESHLTTETILAPEQMNITKMNQLAWSFFNTSSPWLKITTEPNIFVVKWNIC